MKLSDPIAVSPDVVAREVGGEVMLLDLVSGTYFGLNSVGARIWQVLEDEGGTLSDACDVIAAEYDVSREELERDVLDLAEKLVENGLLAKA